jgi:hypothetical protein
LKEYGGVNSIGDLKRTIQNIRLFLDDEKSGGIHHEFHTLI